MAGDPTAILDSHGSVVVFARGIDGTLQQSTDGSDFSSVGTDKFAGDPAAARTISGDVLTFARALDGSLLGSQITGNPSAVLDGAGRVHVFARGTDDALWENFNGAWTSLGGELTGDPAAIRDGRRPAARRRAAGGRRVGLARPGERFAVAAVHLARPRRAAPAAAAGDIKPAPTPTPAPPLVIPPVRRIIVQLTFTTKKPGKTSTAFKALKVKNVPAGATVTATCEKGCSRTSFVARNAYKTVSLERLIDRGALKAGTKVRVVVSMSRTIAAVQTLTVRAKHKPTVATRCLPPGATVESLCAPA